MSDDDNVRQLPRRTRDERVADETHAEAALMCGATGCPNRWSVDAGNGRLCSAHAWVGRHLWPQITDEQQWAETERARRAMEDQPAANCTRRDPERMAKALAKLAKQKEGTAWAKRLRWCEHERGGKLPNGQQMTDYQRWAWRQVLGRIGEPSAEQPESAAAAAPQFSATNDASGVPA